MKAKWFKDAEYTYSMTPLNGENKIEFRFPNAAGGNLEWSDWLYKTKDGKVVKVNMTAELLQCYIDKQYVNPGENNG